MRSESTSALGQPRLTKPTFGLLRLTDFTLFRRWRDGARIVLQKGVQKGLQRGPQNRPPVWRSAADKRASAAIPPVFGHFTVSNSKWRNLRLGSSKTPLNMARGASRARGAVR